MSIKKPQIEPDAESCQDGKNPDVEDWSPLNPAVRALLDHVAEELAAEFIRLTRAAAGEKEAIDESSDLRPI